MNKLSCDTAKLTAIKALVLGKCTNPITNIFVCIITERIEKLGQSPTSNLICSVKEPRKE